MIARGRWWLALTSSTVVMSPLIVLIGIVVALSNSSFADPYWLDLSSKSTISILFAAPGFAALSAWDAARWRVLADTSVRGWLEILGRHLLVVATITVGIFLVTLAILYARQTPLAGTPRFDVIAAGVWVTVAYAAVGFAIGRFLPRLAAAPAAFGVVWLWVAYTPAIQPFWLRNVTGNLGTSCCAMDRELVPSALLAPTVLTTGLLIGVVVVLLWSQQTLAWGAMTGVVALAMFAAASMVSSVGADPVQRRTGDQGCVTARGYTFCAWPEHREVLERAAGPLSITVSRMERAGLRLPRALNEDQVGSGGWSLSLGGDDVSSWRVALATSPLVGLPPPCANRNGGVWPAGSQWELAAAWLSTVAGTSPSDAAADQGASRQRLRRLLARSESRQLAWYRKVEPALHSCERPR